MLLCSYALRLVLMATPALVISLSCVTGSLFICIKALVTRLYNPLTCEFFNKCSAETPRSPSHHLPPHSWSLPKLRAAIISLQGSPSTQGATMARKPDTPCAECGRLLWSGSTSLPAGKRKCRECRRKRRLSFCPTCGTRFDGRSMFCSRRCSNRYGKNRRRGLRVA
jgi:hypothetical protein